MRYRLPEDCAGVSHAGRTLDRAGDGTIEADETDAPALAPHGIAPLSDDEQAAATRRRARADDRRMLR